MRAARRGVHDRRRPVDGSGDQPPPGGVPGLRSGPRMREIRTVSTNVMADRRVRRGSHPNHPRPATRPQHPPTTTEGGCDMGCVNQDIVQDRRDRVVELTKKGWTVKRIAEHLGLTDRTVQRYRKSAGISEPPLPRVSDAQFDAALRLLEDGAPYSEAAATVGCSAHALRRRFPGQGWTKLEVARFSAFMRRMKKAGI